MHACILSRCKYEDADLILKFDTETVLDVLEIPDKGNVTYTLTLTWELIEGEDPTEGSDTILTRPCWTEDCKPTLGAHHSRGRMG